MEFNSGEKGLIDHDKKVLIDHGEKDLIDPGKKVLVGPGEKRLADVPGGKVLIVGDCLDQSLKTDRNRFLGKCQGCKDRCLLLQIQR